MALPNLTGQNIQDTYQRVVQTDGTKLYNGTGSLLPIEFNENNVIISGTLTAQTYVVSESITNVSSGSTIFGNSADDTHTFTGNITSSGDFYFKDGGDDKSIINVEKSLEINFETNNQLTSQNFVIKNDPVGELFKIDDTGVIHFGLNDANLSSKGEMTFMIDSDNDETNQSFHFKNYTTTLAQLHESKGFDIQTNITASGIISASGDISTSGNLIGTIDGGSF